MKKDLKKEIRKLAFDAYLREGDDVSHRINWSLIFHAILLEAFFAAHEHGAVSLVLGALGAITAYLWLLIGIRQNRKMRYLIRAVIEVEPCAIFRVRAVPLR